MYGRNVFNESFNQSVKDRVWEKGFVIQGYDSSLYRKDQCGAWIQYSEYGKETKYGWEIDHIKPKAKGGTDNIENLQPLQWENNRHKADEYPSWSCKNKG